MAEIHNLVKCNICDENYVLYWGSWEYIGNTLLVNLLHEEFASMPYMQRAKFFNTTNNLAKMYPRLGEEMKETARRARAEEINNAIHLVV